MAVAHRVYAEALLQATKEKKVLPAVREEFDAFAAALAESEELRGFLRNPQVETETKLAALDDLLAGGNEIFLNFVHLLAESRRTQRLFNVVMGAIAGISLLVGGIGIMNIMLATVLERTREIGVRRAVGARGRDIRFQFIVESFAISVLGGVVGVVAGLALARGVAAYAGWETIVTGASILLSTGVAMAVGLASGIYPASRAAGLDPIEALRYE